MCDKLNNGENVVGAEKTILPDVAADDIVVKREMEDEYREEDFITLKNEVIIPDAHENIAVNQEGVKMEVVDEEFSGNRDACSYNLTFYPDLAARSPAEHSSIHGN